MNFYELRQYVSILKKLRGLSDFDDDGEFLVEVKDKKLPLREKVRAPSKEVLLGALRRNCFDEIDEEKFKIKLLKYN